MISASHNPVEFNGIKFFDGNGYKLPDAMEDEIEALIRNNMPGIKFPIVLESARSSTVPMPEKSTSIMP